MTGSTAVRATHGVYLGRFLLTSPLRVGVVRNYARRGWIATLVRQEGVEEAVTAWHEWGEGETQEEALADLESTIAERIESLARIPEGKLGEDLLAYKRDLAQYVSVVTTSKVGTIPP